MRKLSLFGQSFCSQNRTYPSFDIYQKKSKPRTTTTNPWKRTGIAGQVSWLEFPQFWFQICLNFPFQETLNMRKHSQLSELMCICMCILYIYIRIYVHIQFLHWLFRILTEKPTHTIFLVPATVHWSQFRKQNLYQNCASNAKACKSMFPLLALCQFVEICHSNLKSSLENNTLSYILLA